MHIIIGGELLKRYNQLKGMKKELYFKLSDNGDISGVTMTLDGCMEWIKNDDINEGDEVEYTIMPVWMTEDEFNNLPEAEL